MEDLTRVTNTSAGYLTRQFTAAMGLPPMAYLTRCRAERAAMRLIQSRDSMGAIAVAVGWDDPVDFARRFRQHYEVTPSEYRRRFSQRPESF